MKRLCQIIPVINKSATPRMILDRMLKSWYTDRGPEEGFQRCFADGLNQSLVSSVAQAI